MSEARSISLAGADGERRRLLGGPPETAAMKSGLVTLEPGASVGLHSTLDNEELIVVLSGRGELHAAGSVLPIAPEQAAYCPPRTEHDVINTGAAPLRYVYVVSRAIP